MPLSRRVMRVDGYDCWEKLLLCGEIKGFNKKNVDKDWPMVWKEKETVAAPKGSGKDCRSVLLAIPFLKCHNLGNQSQGLLFCGHWLHRVPEDWIPTA